MERRSGADAIPIEFIRKSLNGATWVNGCSLQALHPTRRNQMKQQYLQ